MVQIVQLNIRHYVHLSGLAASCSLSFARRRRRKHRNAKTLGSRPGITVSFHDEEFNPFLDFGYPVDWRKYWVICIHVYMYYTFTYNHMFQNFLFIQIQSLLVDML